VLTLESPLDNRDILLDVLVRLVSFFGICGGNLLFTLPLDDLDLDLKKKKGTG